jgi:hypothetical protein
MAAFAVFCLTPVAFGQEITLSPSAVSASTNDGNVPANAVDGSLETRWSGNGNGAWLRFDLGTPQTIGRVTIAWFNGNTRVSTFDIQRSDDNASWTNVVAGAQSSGTTTAEESFDIGPLTTRWIRYVGHGNSDPTKSTWNSVSELSLFAAATTPVVTPTPTAVPTATPTPAPASTATPTPTSTPGGAPVKLTPAGISASTNDGNVPANAIDGSLATRWSANGDGQWLQIDLGAPQLVGSVKVAAYTGNVRQNRFDVLVASAAGGPWTPARTNVSTSGTTTALETFDFTDVTARYVRYLGHGNSASSWNSVTEIEVWGVPGAPVPTATPTPTPVGATATPTPTRPPGGFRHPGVINTRESLDFVKAKVAAGAPPWKAAFDELVASPLASLSRNPAPRAVVECGPFSNPNNGCTEERDDAAAAYAQALLWYYTGNTARAQKAIQYMDAWSPVITDHTDHNARLQTGWAGANWTKAAEIIRHTNAGWSSTGVARFRTMLLNVYYPELQNGAPGGVNGNWELTMIDAMIGIGVFCDDKPIFDKAVGMWRKRVPAYIYITSDGSRPVAPPGGSASDAFWQNPGKYVEGLGQETCRDLGHLTFGFAPMIYTAETALIQGIDLYGEQSRRIRAGLEYNTRIQNGWSGDGICGGSITRNMSETFEVGYNHYVNRRGASMPNTLAFIQAHRPMNRGHHIVWETMTHAEMGSVGVE